MHPTELLYAIHDYLSDAPHPMLDGLLSTPRLSLKKHKIDMYRADLT